MKKQLIQHKGNSKKTQNQNQNETQTPSEIMKTKTVNQWLKNKFSLTLPTSTGSGPVYSSITKN